LTPNDIEALITSALDVSEIDVVSDDNVHFEALVVSPAFAGKRAVARHQMIYAALGDHMRADIHALSIRALTPEEHAGGA
jgi:acid stress-induced BolA-like protein IbaG/YrbA